ncbi:glycosyltransferase family 2 protein [Prochlorococcus marinus]|uniref:Glycosyl transferase, family 2 n=1 Tax=Prochlorococcus marinus (strain MIT 9211) TaxID=93059 RepID=A9BAT0_PROM4|nr:glycosyltransferase [Prochlorococcus marinus]ABX08942.1 Glycosyl transferase, family 2 [Prochlorococcus marinus str. MIT 9211]
MFISVVIPTYNRLPILQKCLIALENQVFSSDIKGYEVVLVDDGSTDGTSSWLRGNLTKFPHLKLLEQLHAGPGQGRNKGVENSLGDVIIFIDSDLVVTESFIDSHSRSLINTWNKRGDRFCFTYGAVINTSNFEYPTSEPHKLRDISFAYFATGNVAIDKNVLEAAGLFDPAFKLYGWEDLELGERLRRMNVELVKCPKAVGYHWHKALSIDQIPSLIRIEHERAKMALVFFRKHPSRRVRFIIQFTLFHRFIWETLTLFGLINTTNLKPLLQYLIRKGYPGLAMEILRLPLNLIGVRAIYREAYSQGLH